MLVVESLLRWLGKITLEPDHDNLCKSSLAIAFITAYESNNTSNSPPGLPTKPAIPPAILKCSISGIRTRWTCNDQEGAAGPLFIATYPWYQRRPTSMLEHPFLRPIASCSHHMPRNGTSSRTSDGAMFPRYRQTDRGHLRCR